MGAGASRQLPNQPNATGAASSSSSNGAAAAVPAGAPGAGYAVPRVSELTDELLTVKARLALAEAKLREQRAGSPGIPHTECVLCMDAAVDTVLLPCGHICLCSKCAESLHRGLAPNGVTCPLCRVRVDRAQRIFLPVHQPPPRFAPNHGTSAGHDLTSQRVMFSSRKLPALGVEARYPPGAARAERSPVSIAWAPLESVAETDGSALFAKTMPVSFEWPTVRFDATEPSR
mmetsp:Transcript_22994/g.46034  ORF Transcript_22994/g.46034 Transcript_22994/m.46034 type:complete len:231 (-) Transcript_22994:332-1024(-)